MRKINIFRDLPEDALCDFLQLCRPRFAEAGMVYTDDPDSEAALFFVWEGKFRLTLMSPAGVHVTLRQLRPGMHFGEFTAFSGIRRRHFNIIADEAGLVLEAPAAAFLDFVCAHKALCVSVLQAIARTAVVHADRVFEFAVLDTKCRILAELLRLSHQGRREGSAIVINPAPTHEALATQTGTTREGVTRALKSLAEHNLVSARRGEIRILNPRRVRALVERESGIRAAYETDLSDAS